MSAGCLISMVLSSWTPAPGRRLQGAIPHHYTHSRRAFIRRPAHGRSHPSLVLPSTDGPERRRRPRHLRAPAVAGGPRAADAGRGRPRLPAHAAADRRDHARRAPARHGGRGEAIVRAAHRDCRRESASSARMEAGTATFASHPLDLFELVESAASRTGGRRRPRRPLRRPRRWGRRADDGRCQPADGRFRDGPPRPPSRARAPVLDRRRTVGFDSRGGHRSAVVVVAAAV